MTDTPTTDTTGAVDGALALLAGYARDIAELDARLTSIRGLRNQLIYETHRDHEHDVTITALAKAADVPQPYAARAIKGEGTPVSGSVMQREAKEAAAAKRAARRKPAATS